AVAIVVLGAGAGLYFGTRRRELPPPDVMDELTEREIEHPELREVGLDEVEELEAGVLVEEPPAPESEVEPPAPTLDRPEAPKGRLARLRSRLARSQSSLGRGLLSLLGGGDLTEEQWEEIEDTLLAADVGVGPTTELVENLRARLAAEGVNDPDRAKAVLREELLGLVGPSLDRHLRTTGDDDLPGVVLVVGVNGTGKTTTVGRLARVLVAEDRTVLLGAADTFRAAAADQLETWGARVGVPVVRGAEGADPASVAFEAVKQGITDGTDVVLVDTAGRLHTKAG